MQEHNVEIIAPASDNKLEYSEALGSPDVVLLVVVAVVVVEGGFEDVDEGLEDVDEGFDDVSVGDFVEALVVVVVVVVG
jgi:hypothetical protein